MQEINITHEKMREFKKTRIKKYLETKCNCEIEINENIIHIKSDPYTEFTVKNVIHAFGRGFDLETAENLFNENCYFSSINIKILFNSKKRIVQIKARLIGREGKAKAYIERTSGAKISVYGGSVSFIGNVEQISEAEIAINSILNGFKHGIAYANMQRYHKKNKVKNRKFAKLYSLIENNENKQ